MPSISVRLPDDISERLESLADATRRSKTVLVTEALADYLEREAWQIAEIQQALKEAEAQDFASDEEVRAVFARLTANAD